MRSIFKLVMIVLSYAPIATVSVAAHAKASELQGEDQDFVLRKYARSIRSRVLLPGQTLTSLDNAKLLYADQTGLSGADLDENMAKDLDRLIKSGFIQIDDKMITGSGPSEHITQ